MLMQCSSNLAPEMFITKETKWDLLCCCLDNSFAAGPVLINTEIPSFLSNQGASTPSNLMTRVKTIWEPCLFQAGLRQVENGDICFLTERDWSDTMGVIWFHLVSFLMYVCLVLSLKNKIQKLSLKNKKTKMPFYCILKSL